MLNSWTLLFHQRCQRQRFDPPLLSAAVGLRAHLLSWTPGSCSLLRILVLIQTLAQRSEPDLEVERGRSAAAPLPLLALL